MIANTLHAIQHMIAGMSIETLSALAMFAFVTSVTPGPNNVMLLASGANFGLRRTVPHMLGIGVGFSGMIVVVGLGLVGLFDAVPASYTVLQVVAVIYLLWLAYRIANAAPPEPGQAGGKPFTFLQAAAFQWVNVKAWTMGLTAIAVYAPDRSVSAVVLVAAVFGLINFPSVSLWALLGVQMRRVLNQPWRLVAFNWTMAALLVASLWPVLRP